MLEDKPKILIVSPTFPYPPISGGKNRIYNLLKQLALFYKITLLALTEEGEGGEKDRENLSFLDNIVLLPIKQDRLTQFGRLLINLPRWVLGAPLEVLVKRSAAMALQFKKLIHENDFYAVQIEYIQGMQYVPDEYFGKAKLLLVAHDVSFVSQKRKADVAAGLGKLFWSLEANRMQAYERRYWHKCDHIIAVSEVDRGIIGQCVPQGKISVVTNGVDCTETVQPPKGCVPAIIFVGWMRHLPNRDAVVWFLKDIWPLIRKKNEKVRLQLVGRGLTKEIQNLASNYSNVELLGQVYDVKTVVGKAWVSVVPIRIGSGSRLKILESMAVGTPVVSTSIGAEGLYVIDKENIRLADHPEEFAQTVLELLGDQSARSSLSAKATHLVNNYYDWRTIGKYAKDAIERAVKSG